MVRSVRSCTKPTTLKRWAKPVLGGKMLKACFTLMSTLMLVSCSVSGSPFEMTSQASGSSYFSLSAPAAYKLDTGLQLTGRICRVARTTLLSPPRVRIEHISIDGMVSEFTSASVAAIYRNADQACANYTKRVNWQVAKGESVRACFDHGDACPFNAPKKLIDGAPVAPASATSNR